MPDQFMRTRCRLSFELKFGSSVTNNCGTTSSLGLLKLKGRFHLQTARSALTPRCGADQSPPPRSLYHQQSSQVRPKEPVLSPRVAGSTDKRTDASPRIRQRLHQTSCSTLACCQQNMRCQIFRWRGQPHRRAPATNIITVRASPPQARLPHKK